MSENNMNNETKAALEAGLALAEPKPLDLSEPAYTVIVPEGGKLETILTERFGLQPRRPRGCYKPATVEALIAVIERHQTADTTIWVHPDSGRIVVVFNDASAGTPGFRDHGALLELVVTKEWSYWLGKDGRQMSQSDFAEHIEDGLEEIVTPAAADMLELAQSIQATQGATFRSALRLQDGTVQVQYDEQVDATAGRSGQMQIPSEFKLAIAPFLGEDPYAVTARLRYRLNGGKLAIGYKLVRPENIVRDALNTIAAKLSDKFGATYIGSPAERLDR